MSPTPTPTPTPPSPEHHELESELQVVEHEIVDPERRRGGVSHTVLQAAWLLIALGRPDPALAAAELAQSFWGIAKDASGSPYGGGLFWAAHRAAALAHMSTQNWAAADTFLLNVLRDFAEEDRAFYLHELCRHARGTRPPNPIWNVLRDPDRELAEFHAPTYALEEHRQDTRYYQHFDHASTAGHQNAPQPVGDREPVPQVPRWRGVPIPAEIARRDWTARQIDDEPDPTIRACAINVFGPERYARDSQLPPDQREPAQDPSQQARQYAWHQAIPRALGRPNTR